MKIKEAELGESIYNFIERIKKEREYGESELLAKFNDIEFSVFHNSNVNDIVIIYNLKMTIHRLNKGE